jgi:hypothetical protein
MPIWRIAMGGRRDAQPPKLDPATSVVAGEIPWPAKFSIARLMAKSRSIDRS